MSFPNPFVNAINAGAAKGNAAPLNMENFPPKLCADIHMWARRGSMDNMDIIDQAFERLSGSFSTRVDGDDILLTCTVHAAATNALCNELDKLVQIAFSGSHDEAFAHKMERICYARERVEAYQSELEDRAAEASSNTE